MAKIDGKFVPENKIFMTDFQKNFIIENFKSMTNDGIAAAIGLKKTYVRLYAYSLGLQREIKMYWNKDQEQFLLDNYATIGNTELAKMINEQFPSEKIFNKKTIEKKLILLGIKRTTKMLANIRERNRLNGMWGRPNESKSNSFVSSWLVINDKLKVQLKPGQDPNEVKEKYSRLAI